MYHQENASNKDTIYAECSGYGRSGVKVFRLSGCRALSIIKLLNPNLSLEANFAKLVTIYYPESKDPIDQSLVIYFQSPQSFTGEDIIEIHTHGSIAISNILYKIFSGIAGVRIAQPGEFAKRAFLNGKMDLTQAEGLADLIDAETEMQHKQSITQFGGKLKNIYEDWRARLIKINALLEYWIDFPDEDIPENVISDALHMIGMLDKEIREHLQDNDRGIKIKEGIKLVILGRPNVGKSSLINYLSQNEIAIISDMPGTTRDILTSHLDIGGYPVTLIDTAGIRDSNHEIEKIGIEKSYQKAEEADVRLIIFDHNSIESGVAQLGAIINENTICIFNKIDLRQPSIQHIHGKKLVPISIKAKLGMNLLESELLNTIKKIAGPRESPAITRARYKDKLNQSIKILSAIHQDKDLVLITEDIRMATRYLSQLTGKISVDDILSEIFSNFCIGK